MLSQRNHKFTAFDCSSNVAVWDARWRIRVVTRSRRRLMSQRIDRIHPPPSYFSYSLFAKVTRVIPDPLIRPPRCEKHPIGTQRLFDPSLRMMHWWNLRIRALRCRGVTLMNDTARHGDKLWSSCSTVVRTVVRGNELTFARVPY